MSPRHTGFTTILSTVSERRTSPHTENLAGTTQSRTCWSLRQPAEVSRTGFQEWGTVEGRVY